MNLVRGLLCERVWKLQGIGGRGVAHRAGRTIYRHAVYSRYDRASETLTRTLQGQHIWALISHSAFSQTRTLHRQHVFLSVIGLGQSLGSGNVRRRETLTRGPGDARYAKSDAGLPTRGK